MNSHTPGPWYVRNVNGNDGVYSAPVRPPQDALWRVIDPGAISGDTDAQVAANAKLIAAAPDLLVALQNMCEEWLDAPKGTALGLERFQNARAALAKAGV